MLSFALQPTETCLDDLNMSLSAPTFRLLLSKSASRRILLIDNVLLWVKSLAIAVVVKESVIFSMFLLADNVKQPRVYLINTMSLKYKPQGGILAQCRVVQRHVALSV